MRRRSRRPAASGVVAVLCAAAMSCGDSPTSPRLNLHVEVADATGDAPTSSVVPNPPDLVSAVVDVAQRDVTFAIEFAPGWDQATTFLTVDVDVDQNPATGVPSQGLGVEYEISPGGIVRFDGMTPTGVGTPSVTTGAGGMTLRLPLSRLGGDDGRMDFRVRVHHSLQPAFDVMPDAGQPPGRVE